MRRVESLLAEMTLSEKVGQLNLATAGQAVTGPAQAGDFFANIRAGHVGGVLNLWGCDAIERVQREAVEGARLGVPLFFGLDVLHGHRTIFPIPLAEAGAFDPALWERTARAAAIEAAHDGVDLTFAPMLDVARDPRWGRMAEGPGEDPLVGARFATAKVRGFQAAALSDKTAIAATAKHFCAGGAALAGRDYAAVDISERALHEAYLPPFRAAVAAGCAAIMPAFNSVAGIPMTAHAALLTGFLRRKLGFEGVIISDYTAIPELIQHGVAADRVEAAALALKAGVDMDMVSGAYLLLPQALARGLVTQDAIDAAALRVLRLKEALGLFEDPYRRCRRSRTAATAAAHRSLARAAARRAMTLVVNRDVLPIPADVRRIALIGPLADARADMLGPWSAAGDPARCVTVLEGLKRALPQCEVVYHAGVGVADDDTRGIRPARALCETAEIVFLCLGESASMSGEAASRAVPGRPGRQRELAEAVLSSGRPVIVILFSGRPLMISELAERAHALLVAWFPGDAAGDAIADIVTGRFNPVGRLAVTWPVNIGQVPIFYAARSSGRPPDSLDPFTSKYLDVSVEPLFPFGHGLSYARISLANLRVRTGDAIKVEVDACNEGSRAGEETIFLFLHDPVALIARPLLELKDFTKIALAPGQRTRVTFALPRESFMFPGEDFEPRFEPGEFEIAVGSSADRKRLLTARVTLSEIVS